MVLNKEIANLFLRYVLFILYIAFSFENVHHLLNTYSWWAQGETVIVLESGIVDPR